MEIFFKGITMTYGKFVGKDIRFKRGINLVYGSNEAGKSTIYRFIGAMLYGQYRRSNKNIVKDRHMYERDKPWYTEFYSGSLEVEKNDEIIHIFRDFNSGVVKVTNLTRGIVLPVPDPRNLGYDILGLSWEEYMAYVAFDFQDPYQSKLGQVDNKDVFIKDLLSSGRIIDLKNIKETLIKENSRIGTDRVSTKELGLVNKDLAILKSQMDSIQANSYDLDKLLIEVEEYRTKKKYYETRLRYAYRPNEPKEEVSLEDYERIINYIGLIRPKEKLSHRFSIWPSLLVPIFLLIGSIILIFKGKIIWGVLLLLASLTILIVMKKWQGSKTSKIDSPSTKYENLIEEEFARVGVTNIDEYKNLVTTKKAKNFTIFEHVDYDETFSSLSYYKDLEKAQEQIIYSYKDDLRKKRSLGEEINDLLKVKDKLKSEVRVNNLLIDALGSISSMAFTTYKTELEDEISKLISKISRGKYEKVLLNKDFEMLVFDKSRSSYIDLKYLSLGTIELVNLAYRLSLRAYKGMDCFPLILENSFNFIDPSRKDIFIEFLKTYGRYKQLILFTNKKSDLSIVDEKQNIIEISD